MVTAQLWLLAAAPDNSNLHLVVSCSNEPIQKVKNWAKIAACFGEILVFKLISRDVDFVGSIGILNWAAGKHEKTPPPSTTAAIALMANHTTTLNEQRRKDLKAGWCLKLRH